MVEKENSVFFSNSILPAYRSIKGVAVGELDAFVSRGGHTQPIHSGVYRITEKMLEQSRSMKYGNHVSDLGIRLAYDMAPDKRRPGGTKNEEELSL